MPRFGRRPVMVAPRRRRGVVGTMARTAVIAGTATAVSRGVGGAMSSAQERSEQAAAADQAALQSQAEIDDMQAQLDAMQMQQAQSSMAAQGAQAGPTAGDDMMTKLQQLAQMKEAGLLTDEEFTAAKARLLAE